jgi:multisubunit Na+/H+ antiporter MnhB subunit
MSARNIVAVIFFAIVAIFLVFAALMIHPFGPEEGQEGFEALMDQYIIDNAQNETGADNSVTSVVFDYRGFDTLGEATVLFTAVAGVILIFRRLKK